MKLPLKWIAAAVVLLLVAAGVQRALSEREAAAQALQAQQAARKQQTTLEIAPGDLLTVHNLELTQSLALTGTLKAVSSAFVKAKAAGDVQGLTVREGETVQAGQVLGRIDTTEYQARLRQAQQQAEAARAQVDIAQRSLDNNKALVDQGFISRTALDTSLNNLAAAQASYRAAQAGADVALKALEDTVLRAPVRGQVSQRLVQNGERVGVDAKVLEIVDLSALELEASLAASDSVRVRTGQVAQISVEGVDTPVRAQVARINPSATAGSRAVLVYLQLQPLPGLRQGLFAQGALATGSVRALALPLDAVRTDKPQPYVQVVADGKVVHQTVTMGALGTHDDVAMVEVRGVAEGAQVLAGAVGALREGTVVKPAAGKP